MQPDPHHCRSSLTAGDFEFIAGVLGADGARGRALRSLFSDDESLDELLDQAKMLQAVLQLPGRLAISPELYFYVLVRHGLRDAGIPERSVADYVASVMAQAARGNPLATRGQPPVDFTWHVDFLRVLDGATPRERFHLQVQCGHQFLILTGLFPRFLENRAARRGAPGLSYYEGVATQAFRDAGNHPLADHFAVGEVYHRLADRFGETRRMLNRMAAEFLFLGA